MLLSLPFPDTPSVLLPFLLTLPGLIPFFGNDRTSGRLAVAPQKRDVEMTVGMAVMRVRHAHVISHYRRHVRMDVANRIAALNLVFYLLYF